MADAPAMIGETPRVVLRPGRDRSVRRRAALALASCLTGLWLGL